MEKLTTKQLMEKCKEIYSQTRGAYFVINCNDEGWKLQIMSSGTLFKGGLKSVLRAYIDEITRERDVIPNPKNPKCIKKYLY
jgi:hypothetical protein